MRVDMHEKMLPLDASPYPTSDQIVHSTMTWVPGEKTRLSQRGPNFID